MASAELKHQARTTALMTLAFAAGLVFGIILLANGDWIPGAIIVAAAAVGMAVEIPVIRKLCSTDPPPTPRKSKVTRARRDEEGGATPVGRGASHSPS